MNVAIDLLGPNSCLVKLAVAQCSLLGGLLSSKSFISALTGTELLLLFQHQLGLSVAEMTL